MAALIELYKCTHAELIAWIKREYGIGLSFDSASGKYISTQYQNPHRMRRAEIAKRIRLYRDDADRDFAELIDNVYEDEKVKRDRKKLIPVAKEQNVTRRIVDEVASLYDKPALITLKARDIEFHAEEKRLNLHELRQEACRLGFLCNEVLLWLYEGIDNKNRLRVVTPDAFDAIPDPRDQNEIAGLLLDMAPVSVLQGDARAKLPHYELWDDTYRYLLDANGNLVTEDGTLANEPIAHEQKRIPGIVLHRRTPSDNQLLDSRHGRDITSAHLGVGLLRIMLMRLAKSQGEQQPYLKGNLANVAAGQRLDGENPIALPPEVDIGMLDLVTDPKHLLDQVKDKVSAVAQSWGMSYEQVTLQETSTEISGKGYEVRRSKLTELRGEMRLRWVNNETAIAVLIGFDATGIKCDHQEQALPQDATEEINLLQLKIKLGLDSLIAYLMRKNPDLTRDEAKALLEANLQDWALVMVKVRALNVPADANVMNPGLDPKFNGRGNLVQSNAAPVDAIAEPGNNPASGATTQNPATGKATAANAGAA